MARPTKCLITNEGRECTKCGGFNTWDSYANSNASNAPNSKQSSCIVCKNKLAKAKVAEKQKRKGITDKGRVCENCNKFKLWNSFPKNKSKKNNFFPRRCISCKKLLEKRRLLDEKTNNWFNWKAKNLRSTWGGRANKIGISRTTLPSVIEIENWLIAQQPFKCYLEGYKLNKDTMEIDHKQPISRGGSFDLHNLGLTSKEANQVKGNLLEIEFLSLIKLLKTWEDKGKSLIKRLKQAKFIYTKRK